jgi:hypothetical protein
MSGTVPFISYYCTVPVLFEIMPVFLLKENEKVACNPSVILCANNAKQV